MRGGNAAPKKQQPGPGFRHGLAPPLAVAQPPMSNTAPDVTTAATPVSNATLMTTAAAPAPTDVAHASQTYWYMHQILNMHPDDWFTTNTPVTLHEWFRLRGQILADAAVPRSPPQTRQPASDSVSHAAHSSSHNNNDCNKNSITEPASAFHSTGRPAGYLAGTAEEDPQEVCSEEDMRSTTAQEDPDSPISNTEHSLRSAPTQSNITDATLTLDSSCTGSRHPTSTSENTL